MAKLNGFVAASQTVSEIHLALQQFSEAADNANSLGGTYFREFLFLPTGAAIKF